MIPATVSRRHLWAVAVAGSFVVLVVIWTLLFLSSDAKAVRASSPDLTHTAPESIACSHSALADCFPELLLPNELENKLDLLVPTVSAEPLPLSLLLHLCQYYGQGALVSGGGLESPTSVVAILTSDALSKKYCGYSMLVRTAHGVRYPTIVSNADPESKAMEAHRDQALAVFAVCGLQLDHSLTLGGERFELRQILEDSVANFTLRQQELHWTALAYSLYMPQRTDWTNRFRETFSFDDLAKELLDRELSKSSCGGSHLIYTLAVFDRVFRTRDSVSPGRKAEIRRRLEEAVVLAEQTQNEDGSWSTDWHSGKFDKQVDVFGRIQRTRDDAGRILATGHLGEIFLVMDREIELPRSMIRKMYEWLCRVASDAATTQTRADCPLTHVARVVRELSVRRETSL